MQTRSLHEMMSVQKEELEEKTRANLEKDRIIGELRKELDSKKGTCLVFCLSFSFST